MSSSSSSASSSKTCVIANRRIATVLNHTATAASCSSSSSSSSSTSPVASLTSHKMAKRPVKVVVTGAAGNIAYAIIFMIGQGRMLGIDQPIELRLLDIPPMAKKLQGVLMEVQDCAFTILDSVIATTDYKEAFDGVDIALLIGAKPRGPGMVRADLLTANAAIFAGQGKALNQYASRNVKVVVVGNPANTNALITMVNAPNIPKQNFTALTRLDQNRANGQIASKIGVPVSSVKNITIWGNHSKTQYPCVHHGHIADYPQRGLMTSVRIAINDEKYLNTEFIPRVQNRGAEVIGARGSSSAASAANATVDHIRSWILGTNDGEWVSMAVCSDGSYGVPKDIIYSFPVTCRNGSWKIVQGLNIDEYSRAKMDATAKELLSERQQALGK
jgi:malate dehydrogenase